MSVYDLTGQPLDAAWNTPGEPQAGVYNAAAEYIPVGEITPTPLDYTNYIQRQLFTYSGDDFDGMAIYDGVAVQLQASNKAYLFDMATGQLTVGKIPITSGHGDTVSFSRQKYDEADRFPLLYISPGTNPPHMYVCRLTGMTSTLIRDYTFPQELTGYYTDHAYDEDNQILYTLGYLEETTDDDGGANKIIVATWDMTRITDNGNGTFTPAFVGSFQRDFIYVIQGVTFHDGYIWVTSGWWDNKACHVYAMRPADGVIDYSIALDDTEEIEGVCWVYDRTDNKYHMVVNQQAHSPARLVYSVFDFGDAVQLPEGYQRLPYIVGNNTASVFDTGVSGNNNGLRVECCVVRNMHSNYSPFWGNYVNESTNAFRLIARNDNTGFLTNANNQAGAPRNLAMGETYVDKEICAVVERGKSMITIGGTKTVISTVAKSDGTTNNNNIAVGNRSAVSGSTGQTRTKWYYVRIRDDGELIRNYIPCLRESDSKCGFYDTVNDTFNPSTGAAEFTEEA